MESNKSAVGYTTHVQRYDVTIKCTRAQFDRIVRVAYHAGVDAFEWIAESDSIEYDRQRMITDDTAAALTGA
jgi:phage-related protein